MAKGVEVTNISSIKVPDRSSLLVVEQKDWDRIKTLVERSKTPDSIWQNIGFFMLATGISLLTTSITVEGISDSYIIMFKVAGVFSIIISIMCFVFHKILLTRTKTDKQIIVDEMEEMERYNKSKVKSPTTYNLSNDVFSENITIEDLDSAIYEEAKKVVIAEGKASTSFLQRKLRIGYARAARLMDMLEENGIVGPAEGASARKILNQKEQD